MDQAPPLPTSRVQQIETESKQLKNKIEEKNRMMNAMMEERREKEEKIEEMMEERRKKEEKIEEMMEERFVTSTRCSILGSGFPTKRCFEI